jgi:hypothetical protein
LTGQISPAQANNPKRSKPEKVSYGDRWEIGIAIAGGVGILAILYTFYEGGSAIENLAKNPDQAILFSALLSIFVWVFNMIFNIYIQNKRSKDGKKLQAEIIELKEEIRRLKK